MVKSLISTICALIILVAGSVYENHFIQKQFTELKNDLINLYSLVDSQTALKSDVLSVQKNWLEKKRFLHAFIPHTEIKEIDLWLSESITLVEDEEWHDAISKIEVLIELSEQIPKTFQISFENVF